MSNLIKYDEESYLFSKKLIIPNIDLIEKNNGVLSVPKTCQMAAEILLSRLDEYENKMDYKEKCAFLCLATFQKQMNEKGFYEFGDRSLFTFISKENDL